MFEAIKCIFESKCQSMISIYGPVYCTVSCSFLLELRKTPTKSESFAFSDKLRMTATSTQGAQSSLIMYTDTNLPTGWKRKVVKRLKGSRYDVYIFSPTGKRFRSRPQLKEYLDKNTQLGLTIDQFSFSLTKDKDGPKHGLTKLIRSTHVSDQKLPNQKGGKCSNEKSELDKISFQALSSRISALNLTIPQPPPPPTTQLVITIHPHQQLTIQVFDHPAIDNVCVIHDDTTSYDDDINNSLASNDENDNINKNLKSFVRRTALQTLLANGEKNDDTISDIKYMETKGKELTELEELDLYYDFEYIRESNEEETSVIRSVFDDDSGEEI